MKNILFIILLLLCQLGLAQRHEIGVRVGVSNLVGDIGNTKYLQFDSKIISKAPIMLGISYKRNFNPYQGIKISFSSISVYFDDANAKEIYRQKRNISGSNNILEGSLTFEYNFLPINNEVKESIWSPYIFAGISGISYDFPNINYTVTQISTGYRVIPQIENYQRRFSGAIPFGLGIKYKFNYNWAIYGEVTFRPTFTDDLDYNNLEKARHTVDYTNIPQSQLSDAAEYFNDFTYNNKTGNINSKDWLNSISVGISYSFGRPPCYCD